MGATGLGTSTPGSYRDRVRECFPFQGAWGGLAVTLLVLAVEGHLSPEVVGGRQNPRVMWEQSGHHTVPTLRHLYLHPHRGSSAAC